jgi:hypothetical protein
VARAEQRGEGREHEAEARREQRPLRAADVLDRAHDGADLEREVRQRADDDEHRRRHADELALVAVRQEVGEAAELPRVHHARDRSPQERGCEAAQRDADVDREEREPVAAREADAAEEAPRGRVDAERERVGPRVIGERGRDPAALHRLGEHEQRREVDEAGDDDRVHGGEA